MGVIQKIGSQIVHISAHALGKSKTGTPHIAVLFEDDAGDRITWYGYLTDKAIERTVESLQVLGWNPAASGGDIETLNGTDLLVGNQAEIVVEMEEYEGKPSPKVRWVNRPGGGLQKMDGAEAATFASSLRQKIMSAAKPMPSVKPGPARPVAPVGAGAPEDDLPF